MSHKEIPGSKKKTYQEHQDLLADLSLKNGFHFQEPNLLDAITCIFMNRLRSDDFLFVSILIRCKKKAQEYQILIGDYYEGRVRIINPISEVKLVIGVVSSVYIEVVKVS